MSPTLDTAAYLDTVCDLLRQGNTQVPVPVAGGSMTPFLHAGDTVFLDPPPEKPKRGQIVLYTRANGDYVLHRIYRVRRNGQLFMAGDAQQRLELLPGKGQICGLVTRVRHQDKLLTRRSIRWQFYRHVWLWLRPCRHVLMAMKRNKK